MSHEGGGGYSSYGQGVPRDGDDVARLGDVRQNCWWDGLNRMVRRSQTQATKTPLALTDCCGT